MPDYSRLDKVNILTALDINDGNIKRTAEEFGVARLTIYNWQKQLQKDIQLLKQVEAAKQNFANLEELTAIKAMAEINKRLDADPHKEKTQDLLKIKDSGINNSRLMRGQPTQINANYEVIALEYARGVRVLPGVESDVEVAEIVRGAGALGVPRGVLEEIAGKIERGELKLLGDGI